MKRGNNPPDQPSHQKGQGSDRKQTNLSSASTVSKMKEGTDNRSRGEDYSNMGERSHHLFDLDQDLHDGRGFTIIDHEEECAEVQDEDNYRPRPGPDDPDRNPPEPYPEDDSEESDSDASSDPEDEKKKKLTKEQAMVSLGHLETVRGAV